MTSPSNDFQDILNAMERDPALRGALRAGTSSPMSSSRYRCASKESRDTLALSKKASAP